MVSLPVLLKRTLHLRRQGLGFCGQFGVMQNLYRHPGQLAKAHHGKQVGRDEERIDAGIVRRAEHREDHAHRARRVAKAA